MAENKWFIPAPGHTVRVPGSRAIVPPEGQLVADSPYWRGLVAHNNGAFGSVPSDKSKPVKKDNANG